MVIRAYSKTEINIASAISRVPTTLPKHMLIGYWHNWQNDLAPFIRLASISPKFDIINIAFALPDNKVPGQMIFHLYKGTTPEQFKSDIAYLHSTGRKVLISVGGANGSLALTNLAAQENFVESMTAIIEEYDFDGIDINLEGKIMLDNGDTDFRTPQSPAITHLITAIRQIRAWFGPGFMLSMAPEMIGIQGGYTTYSGLSGCYLPIIHGLREIISYIHTQHYNAGATLALDGKVYAQGSADFHVAMTEMLLQGFYVNGKMGGSFFAGLKPEQVVIGLPACANAASGGYTEADQIQKALQYLTTGKSFGGVYNLRNPSGYAGFRGVMTWSINWDAVNCHEFSGSTRITLDHLP